MTDKKILEEISRVLPVLKNGGTILYPTDTIWGIGCDATNEEAVKKIFKIKERSDGKSMLVLLDDAVQLNRYVKEVPAAAWDLVEVSDSPLTIIYPGVHHLAGNVIAADGSAGIRIVNDAFCKELIRRLGKPIVSTSANISGQPAPANFNQVDKSVLSRVDYVVNLRQQETKPGKASSIIKIQQDGTFEIIRK